MATATDVLEIAPETAAPAAVHTMHTLNDEGDFRATWNPDNEVEVRTAEKAFARLRKNGFAMFAVDETGDRGRQLNEFDPHERRIIAAPQLAGG